MTQSSSFTKKLIKYLWIIFGVALLAFVVLFFFISRSDLPSFDQLENPESNLATEIYAENGEILGKYFVENRVAVDYEEISPHLIDALISTEDVRFFDHSGIDFRALMRVLFKTVLLGQRSAGGGSTISQQLAKLLFDRPSLKGGKIRRGLQLLVIKLEEWITAARLEKSYTKKEIIALYLNHFNFIYGAYGIQAASQIYFGKSQTALNVEESAMLIGMLKNPSLYNPKRFTEKAMGRREVVLKQMLSNDKIKNTEYDSLRVLPIDMSNFKRESHTQGLAPYFRQELTKFVQKLFNQKENAKSNGEKYNVYRDGLKIYTTINPYMQRHAEKAVYEEMGVLQKRYWRVWKNTDPWKYEADSKEVKRRKEELNKLIRGSERFSALNAKILLPILEDIKNEYKDYVFRDFDILRMLQEEKKKGHFKSLIRDKILPKERLKLYNQLMSSGDWQRVKAAWNELIERSNKVFKKKVKMKVFTYENTRMEKDTVMSPLDSIRYHRMHLQTGVLAIDPNTGYVKAWVGGINHPYFKYDHVQTDRQVGSTFKPFVYATAITMQGISPCYKVDDEQYSISPGEGNFRLAKEWLPSNAGDFSFERMTLYEGLKTSTNSISVYLMKQLGDAQKVRELVKNMGINSDIRRSDGEYRVPRQPSICLGSADLTVMEMTSAYCTFANNGVHASPIFVSHIEDKDGKIVYRAIPEEQQALPEDANFVMVDMLKYAQQNQAASRGIKSAFGGKTGTTNNYVDGWFIGITPNLVIGSWVGGEDRFIRFRSLLNGQGSRMARPTVHNMLKKIEENPLIKFDVKAQFRKPTSRSQIVTDCDLYEDLNYGIPPSDDQFFEENEENEEEDDDFYEGF